MRRGESGGFPAERRGRRASPLLLLLGVVGALWGALFGVSALAETPKRAVRFGLDEGLSQSTVVGLAQTADGRIWMATGEGVTIYGGAAPEYLFRGEDAEKGLRSDYFYAVFVDRDGEIWLGASGGGASLYADEARFLGHAPGEGLAALDVFAFAQDAQGRIWIGSSQGIFLIRKEKGGLVSDEEAQAPALAALKGEKILSLLPLEDGALLIGTAKNGLLLYEPGAPEPVALSSVDAEAPEGLGEEARALFRDREGRIWVGFSHGRDELPGGLRLYDPARKALLPPPVFFPEGTRGVMAIAQGDDGRLWFGSRRMGIFVADAELSGRLENYQAHDWEPHRLSDSDVRALMPDSTGRMWVGTWSGGVNSFSMLPDAFETYYPAPTTGSRSLPAMTWALEEADGALWIGGQGGLGRLDLRERRVEEVEIHKDAWGNEIWSLLHHGGRLLLGVGDGSGLFAYEPRTKESYPILGEDGETLLKDATVRVLMRDAEGNVWAGTNADGLYKLSADLRILAHHTRRALGEEGPSVLPGAQIRSLSQREDGRFWIGTEAGLVLHDPKTGSFEILAGPERLPDDNVRAVYEAEDGRIFAATGGGLGILSADLRPDKFIRQSKAFQSKMLYSLIPDAFGYLWITTNNGLVRYRLSDGEERAFRTSDGLQSREFNFNAFKTLSDGRIAVGGVRGVTIFDPEEVASGDGYPPVLSMRLSGRPNAAGEGPLDLGVEPQSIAFQIGVRHFDDPQANLLRLRFSPSDADFQEHSGSNHVLHRDNLSAGEYELVYYGVSAAGLPTRPQVLKLIVRSGLQRWYATILYLLLGALALAGLALLRARQIRLINAELEETVVEKTRELRESHQALQENADERARFYARAAHEIRTPLALIKAPVQRLLGEGVEEEERRDLAQVVRRASDRLIQLSDEMIAVAQAGGAQAGAPMSSGRAAVDLRAFLDPICALYADSARAKGVELACEIRGPQAATFDLEAAETILHNLLSNAVKHRDPPIRLRLETDLREDRLEIRVSDDGPPLPEEAIRRLEEFQKAPPEASPESPPHRGLDLIAATLRRTKGELEIDRARNEIAVFLPAHARGERRAHEPEEEGSAPEAPEAEAGRILIIEDDRDLRAYLASLISERLGPVRTAASRAAAERALEEAPVDLVLCDVMLPDGSGFDFARRLKTHEDFSHTPLIFLTARKDLNSHRSAWDVWADDYLTKPFDAEELVAKIGIRLRAQEATRAWMRRNLQAAPPAAQEQASDAAEEEGAPRLTAQEERLRRAFEDFLDQRLQDPTTDLAQAAAACLMSERSFQRKLNALYGKSFSALLALARMERARRLLTEGLGVSEVAEASGYRNLASFSRQFKKDNGISPSEFSQQSRRGGDCHLGGK